MVFLDIANAGDGEGRQTFRPCHGEGAGEVWKGGGSGVEWDGMGWGGGGGEGEFEISDLRFQI